MILSGSKTSYYDDYLRKKETGRTLLDPPTLLTDRGAYVNFLEVQLERVSSACMSVQAYDQKFSDMQSLFVNVEQRCNATAKLIALAQQCTEEVREESLTTVERMKADREEEIKLYLDAIHKLTSRIRELESSSKTTETLVSRMNHLEAKYHSLEDEKIKSDLQHRSEIQANKTLLDKMAHDNQALHTHVEHLKAQISRTTFDQNEEMLKLKNMISLSETRVLERLAAQKEEFSANLHTIDCKHTNTIDALQYTHTQRDIEINNIHSKQVAHLSSDISVLRDTLSTDVMALRESVHSVESKLKTAIEGGEGGLTSLQQQQHHAVSTDLLLQKVDDCLDSQNDLQNQLFELETKFISQIGRLLPPSHHGEGAGASQRRDVIGGGGSRRRSRTNTAEFHFIDQASGDRNRDDSDNGENDSDDSEVERASQYNDDGGVERGNRVSTASRYGSSTKQQSSSLNASNKNRSRLDVTDLQESSQRNSYHQSHAASIATATLQRSAMKSRRQSTEAIATPEDQTVNQLQSLLNTLIASQQRSQARPTASSANKASTQNNYQSTGKGSSTSSQGTSGNKHSVNKHSVSQSRSRSASPNGQTNHTSRQSLKSQPSSRGVYNVTIPANIPPEPPTTPVNEALLNTLTDLMTRVNAQQSNTSATQNSNDAQTSTADQQTPMAEQTLLNTLTRMVQNSDQQHINEQPTSADYSLHQSHSVGHSHQGKTHVPRYQSPTSRYRYFGSYHASPQRLRHSTAEGVSLYDLRGIDQQQQRSSSPSSHRPHQSSQSYRWVDRSVDVNSGDREGAYAPSNSLSHPAWKPTRSYQHKPFHHSTVRESRLSSPSPVTPTSDRLSTSTSRISDSNNVVTKVLIDNKTTVPQAVVHGHQLQQQLQQQNTRNDSSTGRNTAGHNQNRLSLSTTQLQNYYDINRSASRGDPQALFQSTHKLFRDISPTTRSRLSRMLHRPPSANGGTADAKDQVKDQVFIDNRDRVSGYAVSGDGKRSKATSASSSTTTVDGGV